MKAETDIVSVEAARFLKSIAFAMGAGLTMMAGLVCWTYVNAAAKLPTATEVQSVNTLTTVMMVVALVSIVASEVLWRALLRKSSGALDTRVRTAYLVRLAFREGAGLLGMTVAYVAALNGVLRVYPAYWANLAPYGLFLLFLATHWPSSETLGAEACGARAGAPQ